MSFGLTRKASTRHSPRMSRWAQRSNTGVCSRGLSSNSKTSLVPSVELLALVKCTVAGEWKEVIAIAGGMTKEKREGVASYSAAVQRHQSPILFLSACLDCEA